MKNERKKILILTAPAGNGHNAMSNAVKAGLLEAYGEDVEVLIYDIFKTASKFRAWMLSKFYFWTAKYFIGSLNRGYEKMKRRDVTKIKKTSLHLLAGGKVRPKTEEVLKDFCPDAVFCAHTAAALVMSDLKKEGKLTVPVFNIISDYDVAPYFECCTHIDYFISASPDLDHDLLRRGVKPEQILYCGIPVLTKFSKPVDKTEARRELGLKDDLFTVMIMNGGVGFGNTLGMIKNIFAAVPEDKLQIVSICGRNKKLKKQIDAYCKKTDKKNLHNIGYATNVDQIMSASDLLIGKIGGVAITEAFNKRVCILASTKLPAQEYDNMVFLTERGACGYIKKPKDAGKIVAEYIDNPEIMTNMRKNMECIRKPSATEDICRAVFKAASGETI